MFIYKITNKLNGRCYVGQTNDFDVRMASHKSSRYQNKLYNAIEKYGKDNFTYEVIREVKGKNKQIELMLTDIYERYYINKYDSFINGYNGMMPYAPNKNKYEDSDIQIGVPSEIAFALISMFTENVAFKNKLDESFDETHFASWLFINALNVEYTGFVSSKWLQPIADKKLSYKP